MTQIATKSVKSLLESETVKNRLQDILGKRSATFATSIIQVVNQNTMLAEAEPNSVVGAAMTAATINLPLNNNLGYAYIIPFREKQKNGQYLTKAQFQIGYKGFIQLAMRSGQFKTIHATDVRQGEILTRDRLTGEMDFQWIDDDALRDKTPCIGYVAYFRLLSGYEATLFMSMAELQKHGKKFSQTFKKGFGLWKDEFDSMAKKTVLKLLLSKKAPMSIEMQTAKETDQAVFNDAENTEDITYVDNDEVQVDHDENRIMEFIEKATTVEDLEFIHPQLTEEHLPAYKEKLKEINKK